MRYILIRVMQLPCGFKSVLKMTLVRLKVLKPKVLNSTVLNFKLIKLRLHQRLMIYKVDHYRRK